MTFCALTAPRHKNQPLPTLVQLHIKRVGVPFHLFGVRSCRARTGSTTSASMTIRTVNHHHHIIARARPMIVPVKRLETGGRRGRVPRRHRGEMMMCNGMLV